MAAGREKDEGTAEAVWRYRAAQLRLEASILSLALRLKAGFNPNQPRVPAGNPDGGQWTDGAVSAGGAGSESLQDLLTLVGGRGRRAGGGAVRVGTRLLPATPAQQTRLAISQSQMEAALRAVQRVDPNWRPIPQLTATVEGQIAANNAIALQAQARLNEIVRERIGPGPFAREGIPATPNRRPTTSQQREINRMGGQWGCHTCGDTDPRTLGKIYRRPPSAAFSRKANEDLPALLFLQCNTGRLGTRL